MRETNNRLRVLKGFNFTGLNIHDVYRSLMVEIGIDELQILRTAFCNGLIFRIIDMIENIPKIKPKRIFPPLQEVAYWYINLYRAF